MTATTPQNNNSPNEEERLELKQPYQSEKTVQAKSATSERYKPSYVGDPNPPLNTSKSKQLLEAVQKIEVFPHGVNYKPAITALKAIVVEAEKKGEKMGRIDEHKVILKSYADWYNNLSKEHGVKQDVPHTAFHAISERRTKELNQLTNQHKGESDGS